MDAREESAHPLPVVLAAEFGPASARARIHGVAKPFVLEQRAAVVHFGRDHRDLGAREFERELVFLENRRRRPAPGPIELDDDRPALLAPHLVHAVLVAVERQDAAVADVAEGF